MPSAYVRCGVSKGKIQSMTATINKTVYLINMQGNVVHTRNMPYDRPHRSTRTLDVSAMNKQFEGQCQCGEVKYRVTGIPVTIFACHCTECQRQSSSAFGMALWIRHGTVELFSGTLQKWVRRTPSGNTMECSFCPTCGTRLFHKVLERSEMMSIKPGTLNDTRWLKPAGHIWTKSAQPWICFDSNLLQYEGNPDTFSELMAAWKH